MVQLPKRHRRWASPPPSPRTWLLVKGSAGVLSPLQPQQVAGNRPFCIRSYMTPQTRIHSSCTSSHARPDYPDNFSDRTDSYATQDFEQKIIEIKDGKFAGKQSENATIFHELVKSDLPPQEKTVRRLNDEAQLVVAAGLVTTAWALSVASFHIVNNTSIFHNLRKELEQAVPDTNAPLEWQQVERLPYLNACVREGIRLSYGVTARNPRRSPKTLVYNGWTIPPRTPVSMTVVDHNHNEEIFPDSHSFLPERWLENKTRSGADLDRYFFSFGKGSRSCLGIK